MRYSQRQTQEELKENQKQLITVCLLDGFACILIVLGVYGGFVANGNAFYSILNNASISYSLIGIGVAIMSACLFRLMFIIQKRQALLKKLSSS